MRTLVTITSPSGSAYTVYTKRFKTISQTLCFAYGYFTARQKVSFDYTDATYTLNGFDYKFNSAFNAYRLRKKINN